jgi:hypothetical protein
VAVAAHLAELNQLEVLAVAEMVELDRQREQPAE